MTDPITITLPFPPTANTYYRMYRGNMVLSKRGRAYKDLVKAQVLLAGSPTFGTARLHVDIQAYLPDLRKRDLDNMRKAPNDALEKAGVFDNDEQIDSDSGRKHHLDKNNPHEPRAVITITPINK